jgi:hypothetical protein
MLREDRDAVKNLSSWPRLPAPVESQQRKNVHIFIHIFTLMEVFTTWLILGPMEV